ncbi:hypothetical protein ACOI9X_02730 [Pseudomonas sp. P2757]|uniref:hypothetical protein n=1 Tax=unclassified Pseudomonas TaxID=196821 RepID=UPI003B59257D
MSAQYQASPMLDPAWGSQGIVNPVFPAGSAPFMQSVATGPGDKITYGGIFFDSSHDFNFFVGQLNADGSANKNFNNGAVVIDSFGQAEIPYCLCVAVCDDPVNPKIYWAGQSSAPGPNMRVARFNSDGSLDQSFGNAGYVNLTLDVSLNGVSVREPSLLGNSASASGSVHLLPDGKLVLSIYYLTGIGGPGWGYIVRLHSDGSLDKSLNGTGYFQVRHSGSHATQQTCTLISNGGDYLSAGAMFDPSADPNHVPMFARHHPDGTPDKVFGDNGFSVIADPALAKTRLAAMGQLSTGDFVGMGSVIPSFESGLLVGVDQSGNRLWSTVSRFGGESTAWASGVVDANDRILVGGGQRRSGGGKFDVVVARFLKDGQIDPAYNLAGYVIIPSADETVVYAMAIQSDQKVLVVVETSGQPTLLRLLAPV